MVTKRMLGIALLTGGLLLMAGAIAVDWIGAGNFQGLGPAQRLALAIGGLVALLGLTLIPLGNRPA